MDNSINYSCDYELHVNETMKKCFCVDNIDIFISRYFNYLNDLDVVKQAIYIVYNKFHSYATINGVFEEDYFIILIKKYLYVSTITYLVRDFISLSYEDRITISKMAIKSFEEKNDNGLSDYNLAKFYNISISQAAEINRYGSDIKNKLSFDDISYSFEEKLVNYLDDDKVLNLLYHQISKKDYRIIFYLRYIKDLTFVDIADLLKCTPQAVKDKHKRLIKKLIKDNNL